MRYYFDIREGSRFIVDEEGEELPDADAAEREAIEVAACLGRDRLPNKDTRIISIEVRGVHHERMLAVTVAMTVERMPV